MLQDIRKNAQGTASKIIIGLIVLAFAAFGIDSILLGGGGGGVAEVNGEEISPADLQRAEVMHSRQIIAAMGENYDPALLDEDQIRTQALESLLRRTALVQSAQALDLTMSDAEIAAVITGIEQFKIDGKFNPELYKGLLSENGYTPASYKRNLSDDLVLTQVRSGLAGSEFVTTGEIALNAGIVAEQRDFRYLTIPSTQFAAAEDVSEAQVQAFYEDNESDFYTEESVDLEYIELSLQDYLQPLTEQEIEDAYQVALEQFQGGTENRVSHILLTESGDEPIADRLARVQAELAGGAEFATLAQQYSEDIGSASRGGDLGYSKGDTFPEEMEEAIARLQPKEVSAPVETDAGTHLILLTERRVITPPTLEEMRPELEASLAEEAARTELLRQVEQLRDLSFNADDLHTPAAEMELEVAEAAAVSRLSGEGLFQHAALREAAFSDEVLGAGHNSDVMELAGDQFVVLRVKRFNESTLRPLEEVRDTIVARVIETSVRAAVAAEADGIVAAVQSGEAMDEIAQEKGYEWQVELAASRASFSVAPSIVSRAFALPVPEGGSVVDYILEDNGDAVVIELTQVQSGTLDALSPPEQQQLRRSLANESGLLMDAEYQQAVRQSAEINVMM